MVLPTPLLAPGLLLLLLPAAAQDPAATPSQQDDPQRESYLAHVAAAHASLRLGETAALRRWLDGAPAPLRGFEWRWLDARCDESLRALELGGSPYAVALGPDGERVAVAQPDGAVVVRAVADGRPLARMEGHAEAAFTVDFDPAGERLLSSSYDRTVKLWDARSGELLLDFSGHGFPVGGAAFSPDGELVVSSSYERDPVRGVVGTVHLWSSLTGEVLRTFEAGRKPIVDVRFSADGTRLAAASWDFCVYLWDLRSDGPPRTLAMPEEDLYNAVDDVAFSPDGGRVAGASKDGTARVWDSDSGELVLTLRGHDNDVTAVAFSPDGGVIATASADQTVRLWGGEDGAPRGVLRGHLQRVDDVVFRPDGRLFSASPDGTLREWDASVDWYGGVVRRTSDACYAAVFRPDGGRLATCSYDGRVQQWDPATWELLAAWQAHPQDQSCHALAWTPDGERLASGSWDKSVALWDAVTLEELDRLEHDSGVHRLAIAPDGRTLAVALSASIWLWDLSSRERLRTLDQVGSTTTDLAFSPDGARLYAANRDRTLRAWDVSTGDELRSLPLGVEPRAVSPAPDGSVIALSIGSEVRLLDARSWDERARLVAGDNAVVRLAWSPDGRRLAGSSAFVPLLDPVGPALVATLRPHRESGWDLGWSPDGARLATAAMDGTLAITDAVPLRRRLAERDRALALRARAAARVDALLAEGSAPLRDLASALRADRALDPETRAACLDQLTLRAAVGR